RDRKASSAVASGFSRTSTIDVLIGETDTQFNAPRWSPDGRLIAVERHRLGDDPEIVVVDPASQSLRVVAARPQTRIVMPAWRRAGGALVAAGAGDDQVFMLVETPLDASGPLRPLTHTSGGATWPDVSPDGRLLTFVGYTIDGSDIFTMPYPAGAPAETTAD